MANMIRDLRYALRVLLKSPGFTIVAVLTLALGIGANTAIFSVVHAVLLRPLPYPDANRLVFLGEWSEEVPEMSISMANFNDWQAQNTIFASMVPYQSDNVVLTGRGEPERLRLKRITAGFFPTLRVRPVLGRELTPEDDKVGAPRVVLLGEDFWERRFGRDPNIIGQQLTLDAEPFTVIGILSSRLHGSLRQADLFTSLWRLEDQLGGEANRGSHPGIYAYARMKPGVTVEQARTEMKNIARRLDELHPATDGNDSVVVQPLLDAVVEDVKPSLLILMGAVGFVLLIACANITNLLLARATERYRELAVRMALGAGRGRLIRQVLTESLLLSIAGGTLGLLLAVWITAALVRGVPAGVPRMDEVSADRSVLLFTLGLSLLTGIVFGILPALQASRTDVQDTLREGGRTGTAGGGRRRLRDVLVAAEVAVSLVLLVGAGLMTKSLFRVLQADGGINPASVLTGRFSLPDARYNEDAKRRNFISELVAKVQSLPGVDAAGFKNPLLGGWQTAYVIEGRPLPPPGHLPSTDIGRVSPDAMRAMGMRLLSGRLFDEHDNENSLHVCIIDETFARQNFPGTDSLGKRINTDGPPDAGNQPDWLTIIGVVAHVKNYGVDQPSRVETYVPVAQRPSYGGSIVVRSAGNPAGLTAELREAVHSLDPDIPVYEIRPLEDIVNENTASRRLSVLLIGSFAILALLLAAVGVYGVMAYVVTQRGHEIGIRMALGASQRDILGMVFQQGLRLALIGIIAGLAGAVALTRVISNLLFHVSALDVPILASGALALAAIVLLACWLPARRATRVDPILTLRYE
ncbi:MAG TPA: ABC transporter permease [Candidatus Acidoferrum sp.]|nr:ABC transporter permease [Candidatus Acidoferrum sp.]